MISKERVRKAIEHAQTDRVPIDFSARQEVYEKLGGILGLKPGESVEQRLEVDLRGVGPAIKRSASPLCYADPTIKVENNVYFDIWGVGFRQNRTESGEYMDLCFNPLKKISGVKELDDHPWPAADMWDYSSLFDQANANRDFWVGAHSRGMFEIAWFIRGFEEFMVDMLVNPGLASALLDRIQEYLMARSERILAEGKGLIDMMEYNDDVGGQNGMLINPDLWRRFIKPRMASFIKMCGKYNARIRFHSCGGIRPIIPDLIEIGVDVLNPVQTLAAGMEPAGLKKDFGGRLAFNGGIDTQELLVNSTPEQVRGEVSRLISIFGRNGGYILAPSHVFQGDVPIENVVAVYEIALNKKLSV